MKFYLRILVILSFTFQQNVNAQDPQFSHLYAMPLHLGPSFAGATGGTRAALNTRNQWTAVKQEYFTFSAMVDHYFYGTRNGGGLVLLRDQAGAGKLTTSSIIGQYAYSMNLNKDIALRPGIQVSYIHRNIDYSKIVFGDQLDFEQDRPNSIEPSLINKTSYLDFSASLLSIYKNLWLGFTLNHINTPNQSLLNQSSDIPLRYIVYSGAKFQLETFFNKKRKRENLYLMLHYNQQGNAKQALSGAYWEHHNCIIGFWYRGIPFSKAYDAYINNDAFILMLGIKKNNFTFLYSYDFTSSKLMAKTAGSQEVTITWNWSNEKKKKRLIVVPCPMQDNSREKFNQHNM